MSNTTRKGRWIKSGSRKENEQFHELGFGLISH